MRARMRNAISGGQLIKFEVRPTVRLSRDDQTAWRQRTGGLNQTEGIGASVLMVAREIGGKKRLKKPMAKHVFVETDRVISNEDRGRPSDEPPMGSDE